MKYIPQRNEETETIIEEKPASKFNETYNQTNIKARNTLVYCIIAFMFGVSGFSEMAIQFFLKDELGLEPSQFAIYSTITFSPWYFKPLYGLLSDMLPICGYRRKHYITICSTLAIAAWLAMAFYVSCVIHTIIAYTIVSFCNSFITLLGQTIVVEISQLEEKTVDKNSKKNISYNLISEYLGTMIGAILGGFFVKHLPLRTIFIIASSVYVVILISGFILIENKVDTKTEENNLLLSFFRFIFKREILIPNGFIILFIMIPTSDAVLFFF
jgi:MFS family permease